jgi:arylsulfatase A-like enzyme
MPTHAAARRPYVRRWLDVAGAAVLAAFAAATLEVLFVAAMVPAAPSDVVGLLLAWVMTFALFGAWALACSAALAVVGKARVKQVLVRARGAWTFAIAWTLVAIVPLAKLRGLFDEDWQFPRDMNAIHALLAMIVLFVVLGLAHSARRRFGAALAARVPRRLRRNGGALVVALAALVGVVVSHLYLQPEYLVYECGVAGAFAILLATIAACAVTPRARSKRDAAPALLVAACAIAWLVPGAGRDHARFLVWNHGAIAAPMAKLVRDMLDRDHDGSSPTWLGGTDCAEGDAKRGPLLREIPNDGIDQDCQGGDAPVPAPPPPAIVSPACRLPEGKLSVLLLTIDALRADRATADALPALFALARRSTTFTRAYSPTGLTMTSIPALLASRPLADMVDNALKDGDMRAPSTLATLFHAAGWRTAAFNSFGEMHEIQRRGFDSFNDEWMDAYPRGAESMLTSRTLAREAISFASASDTPFFAWVHFSDVHSPYKFDRDERGRARTEDQSYDLDVAYVGNALDSLFGAMVAHRLLERTIIVVTADHGEELMARGREGHGANLFEECTHVPLVVWVPGCAPGVVERPVGTTQIGPTLGALTGVNIPGWGLFDARPLPVVTEATVGYDIQYKRAVVGERYKLIVDVANGGKMLFDLVADPNEATNIYGSNEEARGVMEAAYQRWLDAPGAR